MKDFSSPEFWNSFFRARDNEAFEWYGDYADFEPALSKRCPPSAGVRTLVVGCGNSVMSEHMHAAGYREQLNIDFSPVVIEEMRVKYQARVGAGGDLAGMLFEQMDMTNLVGVGDGGEDSVSQVY